MVLAMASAIGTAALAAPPQATVSFNRDVLPVLSDNCFHCHGPDKSHRQAELRLDTEEGALAQLESGAYPIVPGDVAKSEVARRILSDDPDDCMPPADSGRKLTSAQKDILVRWIKEGAPWQKHWSLIPPERPAIPPVSDSDWPRVAWDAFVLAALDREGLKPSPMADKATLLRRVTLDLTGLPPTPEELDAFLADNSPDAYEKVVDRLLALPRFGERMASDWLDAARYADTNGYQTDGVRYMWRWRDWVIDALNANMPFDQFTIEQLAGDMLDSPTLAQRIATGFNRNHSGNAEGGIIPEEFAVEYVVDRVNTTATVWLGLTMGCARCHDHKFDPISQKEFYRLFALFNNVPEQGRAAKFGNSDPQIKAPTAAQQAELSRLDEQLAAARARFEILQPQIAQAQALWQKTAVASSQEDWWPTGDLLFDLPLDGNIEPRAGSANTLAGNTLAGNTLAGNATSPAYGNGKHRQAAELSGSQAFDVGDVANFGFNDRFSFSLWIEPKRLDGIVLGRMAETADAEGYNLELRNGKLQLNLIKRWLDDALRVETAKPLRADCWQHVVVTYDGSRVAKGVKIYIDGRPSKLRVLVDELNQTFATKQPLVLGAGGTGPRFAGKLDELKIYGRVLSAEEAELLATPTPIANILALPASQRSSNQVRKLAACFLDRHAPSSIAQVRHEIRNLQSQKLTLEDSIPTTMVMEELPEPRPAFVLLRGEYDKPGERVEPAVPASLSWPDQGPIRNRLDFARWLVSPKNPLTARVTVNRIWQLYFGRGLVKTTNDFGVQGDRPTHPELLDYLACEFMSSGWNLKALHKSIVMSATYRQSSRLTPLLAERDPDNRLLARGPRHRLPAEMIRDQALAASGLLVEQLGGPSVMPYQPPGLWKELGDVDYTQDHGDSLYRRSLYTFWKRTVAPPSMITFDASDRETCRVLQTRTNTPLQALTLLNEITFVEAARKLAERMFVEGGDSPDARLAFAYRVVLARQPTKAELAILTAGLKRHQKHYREHPQAAAELLTIGESLRDANLDPIDLAAYTAIANTLLNLDETITKQ